MVRGRGTWDGGHEARNGTTHAGYSRKQQQQEQGAKCMSGWGGRVEGQRIRPSSQASLEAAASSATSVDSQPPFGTMSFRKKQG
jgi:hypothetical protein